MVELDWLLPQGMTPSVGVFLVVLSAITSFMTAAMGLGGGQVMFAAMALFIPASALIPIHGFVQLGSSVSRASALFHSIQIDVVFTFFLGSVLGIAFGAPVVAYVPTWFMELALAVFILWSAWEKPPKVSTARRIVPIGGGISSFLTMFLGATGPFTAAILKTQGFDRLGHASTQAACMVVQHALKVVAFGLIGFAFTEYIAIISMMIATGAVGTFLGKRLLLTMSDNRFEVILRWILTFLAYRLFANGAYNFFS